jgi:hypothetical protein
MDTDLDPWRDPSYYQNGPIVKCSGCGNKCNETHWGKWCFKCNVERIERISRAFKELLK